MSLGLRLQRRQQFICDAEACLYALDRSYPIPSSYLSAGRLTQSQSFAAKEHAILVRLRLLRERLGDCDGEDLRGQSMCLCETPIENMPHSDGKGFCVAATPAVSQVCRRQRNLRNSILG